MEKINLKAFIKYAKDNNLVKDGIINSKTLKENAEIVRNLYEFKNSIVLFIPLPCANFVKIGEVLIEEDLLGRTHGNFPLVVKNSTTQKYFEGETKFDGKIIYLVSIQTNFIQNLGNKNFSSNKVITELSKYADDGEEIILIRGIIVDPNFKQTEEEIKEDPKYTVKIEIIPDSFPEKKISASLTSNHLKDSVKNFGIPNSEALYQVFEELLKEANL